MNKASCKIKRCATKEDLEASLAIRRRVFTELMKIPESVEMDSHDAESTCFLALNEYQRPIGTARWRPWGCLLKIERVAILPEVRELGVGRALMEYMQQLSNLVHPNLLKYLHAQTPVAGFYAKLGWTQIGNEFIEAGLPHQKMIFTATLPEDLSQLMIFNDPHAPQDVLEHLNGLGKWLPKK